MTPVVRASTLGIAACLCAVGPVAHAASNVQVDMSVLDDLGPPSNADTGGPVVLTPPRRAAVSAETKPAVEASDAGLAARATKVAATGPAAGGADRLIFARGSAELPASAARVLAPLAKTLAADPAALLSVEAYAVADEGRAAGDEGARRLALSRGLAVRRYLETHGVDGARALIDARGAAVGGGPADRVDLAIARH